MKILIDANGTLRHLYRDDLVELDVKLGDRRVARASHVEPNDAGHWAADMKPVGGPLLGPFLSRAEALACEVNWLERNNLPEVRR